MSTLEIKAKAFETLAAINEEATLKEVLSYLESLKKSVKEFDADSFFNEASEKYGNVLQKLAQ